MKKIIKKTLLGIMLGFTIMVFSLFILLLTVDDSSIYLTKESILTNIWVSAVVGIAFYLPSLVYENNKISKVLKTLIHMGIGYIVFFPLAIYARWIPTDYGSVVVVVVICFMLVVSWGIWFGYYLYYKHEAKLINKKILERNKLLKTQKSNNI